MDNQKLVFLFTNKPEFINRIVKMDSEKDVLKEFLKEGITLTSEELISIGEIIKESLINKGNGDKRINDNALDKIAGGKGIGKREAAIIASAIIATVGANIGIAWLATKSNK